MPALTFTVLKSDEVFAFSHPGGYLYVSRGLFNFVRNDDELQFQIARELAHMEKNHLIYDAAARSEPALDLAQRLYRQIALGYTDAQVFAADEQAFRTLRRLGRPAYKLLSWLSPASDLNGEADPRGTRRKPASSALDRCQDVENHWHSYPPASVRFERLRSLQQTQGDEREQPAPLAG
jgi:Zn-dependent protease with chaperone function